MEVAKRKQQARILRIARRLHRTTGALLFVFFFIVACTGLLLGWKKHTAALSCQNLFRDNQPIRRIGSRLRCYIKKP